MSWTGSRRDSEVYVNPTGIIHCSMTEVEIEYCVPCGHLDRAIDVQRDILSDLAEQIDGVTLVTGDGGDFIVRVDGETIYDKAQAEEAFDIDQIKDEIGTRATA